MRSTRVNSVLAAMALSHAAWAAVLRVPQDYATIQAAMDHAAAGDTVVIAPGTYTGAGNTDVEIRKAVTVRGIAPGDPCSVAGTVIDCQGAGRAFRFRGEQSSPAVLAGLTITGGRAKNGSGIYILRSSPTITRCSIVGNGLRAAEPPPTQVSPARPEPGDPVNGGGIFLRDSYATISYCLIADNGVLDYGGGICCYAGTPTITNCTIVNNRVRNEGGGISLVQGSNPALRRCLITGNAATFRRGGGVACRSSFCSLANCLVAGNRTGPGGGGGGLWLYRSAVSISNCTIADNVSEAIGGGIYADLCDVLIENSILWGNSVLPAPRPNEVRVRRSGRADEIAVHSWQGRYEGVAPSSDLTPEHNSFLTISYTDLRGGRKGISVFGTPGWLQLVWRRGNLQADPLFAHAAGGDYHLQSQAGRWDPARRTWVRDEVTSPCIDAGDPLLPVAEEPAPNGGILNLGAYGGTAEASKSYTQGSAPEALGAGL
jgi:parallel beta-helix repeat protein